MLGLLCSCTVTTLPGLLGVGPCQAAAWLPVWWHAWDRHCLGTDPLGGRRIGGDTAAVLPSLKLGILSSFLYFCGRCTCLGATILSAMLAGTGVGYSTATTTLLVAHIQLVGAGASAMDSLRTERHAVGGVERAHKSAVGVAVEVVSSCPGNKAPALYRVGHMSESASLTACRGESNFIYKSAPMAWS